MKKKIFSAILVTALFIGLISTGTTASAVGETVRYEFDGGGMGPEYIYSMNLTNIENHDMVSYRETVSRYSLSDEQLSELVFYTGSEDYWDSMQVYYFESSTSVTMDFTNAFMRQLQIVADDVQNATIDSHIVMGQYPYWPDTTEVILPGTYVTLHEPGVYVVIPMPVIGIQPRPIFVIIGTPVTPVTPLPFTVSPTSSTVYVNGEAVSFDAYNINDYNYFKLRDLAYALNGSSKQFSVGWDDATNTITLTSGVAYSAVGGEMAEGDGTDKQANPTTSTLYLDGQELSLTAYNINDNNFFRLRDLMSALDIGVTWDEATSTIGIDTSLPYVED